MSDLALQARHCRSAAPLMLALALVTGGCANIKPHVPPSEGHITTPAAAKAEPDRTIPPPARVTEFVPPPRPATKPQTYSVVVNEVPVKELLLALARDTKQNIDIHPGLAGLVSLNAINETLPAILERLSKQVNMRYRMEGNTLVVSPDSTFVKTYRVNYVNMTRETTSSVGVSGEIAAVGAATTTTTSSSSGSNTRVTTVTKNDFWEQLASNLRAILNSTRLQSLTADAKAERLALEKQAQEFRTKQLEAASRAGAGAPNLASSAIPAPTGGQPQGALLPDDVVVNPISGTVTINATEKQHQLVQQHIDSIINAMQRQVLIEATIVEVQLSNNYQGGIDWGRVSQSGGIAFTQALIGTNLAAAPFVAMFYNQANTRIGDLNLTVKLLEQFGNTRVLSSPKLMAVNNQTALLKVVDNFVYFEVQTTPAVLGAGGVVTPGTTNTTAKTVAVGLVMSVTPQINEDGRVTLSVRPTITRVIDTVRDPNPVLVIPNEVPVIQTREMESVLQVGNSQTVILGGLMQDDVRRSRDQLPGADRVGPAGELLRFRDEQVSKTELVIFLRPTVITNPSLESDELKFFQRFLPRPEATPPQPERTGAAR